MFKGLSLVLMTHLSNHSGPNRIQIACVDDGEKGGTEVNTDDKK